MLEYVVIGVAVIGAVFLFGGLIAAFQESTDPPPNRMDHSGHSSGDYEDTNIATMKPIRRALRRNYSKGIGSW